MTQVEIVKNQEFRDRLQLALIVIARNVYNEGAVPNAAERLAVTMAIFANPYSKIEQALWLSASRYDATGWAAKSDQDKKNDCEYLISQIWNELAGI
jgi:hypothetical protein